MTDTTVGQTPIARSETGRELRDQAVEAVGNAADSRWMAVAHVTILRLARKHDRFTTDEVWAEIERLHPFTTVAEPRAMGAAMTKAHREGIISPTPEYVQSTRPQNHARPIRVWRSCTVEVDSRQGRMFE